MRLSVVVVSGKEEMKNYNNALQLFWVYYSSSTPPQHHYPLLWLLSINNNRRIYRSTRSNNAISSLLCSISKSTTLFDLDVRHATKLLFSSPLNPLPDSDEQMYVRYRKKQMCNTADLIRKCVRFAIIFKLALLAQPLHSTNLLLYNETSPKI